MVSLIVLGGNRNDAFSEGLCSALSAQFQILQVQSCPNGEAGFVLVLQEAGQASEKQASVVLFHPEYDGQAAASSSYLGVGVLSSDHPSAIHTLRGWNIPVITCGMAATDTLTFSSFTTDSAVLCLQRSIPTLDGLVVEPGEMPLHLARPYSRYMLLGAASVFLLAGCWERLKELAL